MSNQSLGTQTAVDVGTTVVPAPAATNPEISDRPRRRTFSAPDKLHILKEADQATFCTGISAALFGERGAAAGLVLVGLCGLLLLWTAMPETRLPQRVPVGMVASE